MTIINKELNDVAIDIISVITVWNLVNMYYNVVPNQHRKYMIFGAISYGFSIFMIHKYY